MLGILYLRILSAIIFSKGLTNSLYASGLIKLAEAGPSPIHIEEGLNDATSST